MHVSVGGFSYGDARCRLSVSEIGHQLQWSSHGAHLHRHSAHCWRWLAGKFGLQARTCRNMQCICMFVASCFSDFCEFSSTNKTRGHPYKFKARRTVVVSATDFFTETVTKLFGTLCRKLYILGLYQPLRIWSPELIFQYLKGYTYWFVPIVICFCLTVSLGLFLSLVLSFPGAAAGAARCLVVLHAHSS